MFSQKDTARGLDLLRAAVRLEPEDPDILHGLGSACLYSGETREAIDVLERALARSEASDPAHATIRQDLATAREALGG